MSTRSTTSTRSIPLRKRPPRGITINIAHIEYQTDEASLRSRRLPATPTS